MIKNSLLYGAETWRLTENNKRRFEATEMDGLRRSSRISRTDRIRNVTIKHKIGLEETIIKQIEVREYLLLFGTKSFVFQFAIQKVKDQDIRV